MAQRDARIKEKMIGRDVYGPASHLKQAITNTRPGSARVLSRSWNPLRMEFLWPLWDPISVLHNLLIKMFSWHPMWTFQASIHGSNRLYRQLRNILVFCVCSYLSSPYGLLLDCPLDSFLLYYAIAAPAKSLALKSSWFSGSLLDPLQVWASSLESRNFS